ncbi:MAG: cystathionine gamma-synthase [Acidimicrobiaceae bacterium]|nr:cystathionine gamma-synthase [Acidimicrobiaceae bacterium]
MTTPDGPETSDPGDPPDTGDGSDPRDTSDNGSDGGAEYGFETLAIHAGQDPDPTTGAVVTPIYQTSTYAQEAVGKHQGYEYSRTANPTRTALQQCLAALEGADHGLAFASGLAAEHAVLHLLEPNDHILIPHDAYGGTYRLVARVQGPRGLEFTPVDLSDLDAVAAAWRPETRLVWVETPTNPLLSIVDIEAVARFAHERGALVVVDNTFATPYLQRPLALGADVVVHSSTKYLGGHSDVVGGLVATKDPGVAEQLAFLQNAVGAVPGPFDCFLTLRGIKTLAVRMDRHCATAAAVVELLGNHPKVDRVFYPGRADHPGHEVAARQMRGFGGMVSFTVAAGEDAALEVARSTRLWTLAESLGAVESLIEHPHRMTHASVADSPLAVDPALLRLSVGLETANDLLGDLRQALDRVG